MKTKQPKRVTTSIRLDPDVWREAKKLSIDLGCSVGEFMESMIKKELKVKKPKN